MKKMSPAQLRAARALLNWSRAELAKHSGISEPTLHRFENGETESTSKTAEKLFRIFDEHGVEFIDDQGVRFKPSNLEVFVGPNRFHEFTEFVYQYLVQHGGDVCISAVDETLFQKYRKNIELYRERMLALVNRGDVTVRILATESKFHSLFAQIKWQPRHSLTPTAFYAFGNCLALISFDHDPAPYVVLHKSGPFAEAYKQAFNIAWANAKDPSERPINTNS